MRSKVSFDYAIWKSLFNAPPPGQLFTELLCILSGNPASQRHLAPAALIDLLMSHLEKNRCLIIIDNFESVLQPGNPTMRYRETYEPYGKFLDQVARVQHKSCLLLTSREKPREVADLEGARRPVRTLALAGIGVTESRQLFDQIGSFEGSDGNWDAIVKLYHGNPLALELLAKHIEQVFAGSIASFLREGRPIFSDLRDLLDWHLDRLSEEETEVMYWLAIERAPVSRQSLSEDMLSPASRDHIASTLQSLQRRVPLERSKDQAFALQPVLVEHLTSRLVDQVGNEFTIGRADAYFRVAERLIDKVQAEIESGVPNFINKFFLLKATARDHIRESQRRLILAPVADRLVASLGNRTALVNHLFSLLDRWRRDRVTAGYATGNIINLLVFLRVDLACVNLSNLPIWQAYLQEVSLHGVDFSLSDFRHTSFMHTFGTIFTVSYSPNGKLIATGDDNNEVRVFDVASGQIRFVCTGHSSFINAVAFSPDGNIVASGSMDGTIRLWSAIDGSCMNILHGHTDWVNSIAFSADGEVLISGGEDRTVRLWKLGSPTMVTILCEQAYQIAAVAFSSDGGTLALADSSGIAILARQDTSWLQTTTLVSRGVRTLAFSPDGRSLVSGGEDSCIRMWALEVQQAAVLTGHSGCVRSVAFSRAGDTLATGGDDGTIRFWNPATGECLGKIVASEGRIWSIGISPCGLAVVAGSEDKSVLIWDIEERQLLLSLHGYCNKIWSVAFGSDPTVVASGSEDGLVRVWNTEQGDMKMELAGHRSRIWAVAFSPSQRWIASASDDLTIRVWEYPRGNCKQVLLGHEGWIRALAFSSDSSLLASGAEDDTIRIWDVATGRCIGLIQAELKRVLSLEFGRSSPYLVAAGENCIIKIWRPSYHSEPQELKGHTDKVRGVSLSVDDSCLASCSEDGSLKLWNMANLECTATIYLGNKIWALTFCCAGRLVASGSEDGIIRLWNVHSGECEAELRGHESRIWTVATVPGDDTVIVSGDDVGGLRAWRLESDYSASSVAFFPRRPYERMNIFGASGLTAADRINLNKLGAIETSP
jgi:WD40 repeat protein